MKCLYELLKGHYDSVMNSNFGLLPFDELIKSGDECARFIRIVLHDKEAYPLKNKPDIAVHYDFVKERSLHAVLSFLIGCLFLPFENLSKEIYKSFKSSFQSSISPEDAVKRLWMFTALYHDWGYGSKNLSKKDYEFPETYNLLIDEYEDSRLMCLKDYSQRFPRAFAHSYEQIDLYDRYAREYHEREDYRSALNRPKESIDHGILGGRMIFDRLIREELKGSCVRNEEMLIYKAACLTIAQHNIFKSNSLERDKRYELYCGSDGLRYLYHNSGFFIGMSTPLLLLLCLVDTLECMKRFGKQEIPNGSIRTNTILDNIFLEVGPNSICIDYSDLESYIKRTKPFETVEQFERYIHGVCGMNTWTKLTPVRISRSGGTRIEIRMDAERINQL